ncbi:alpha/beta fold hydrolase [Lentzea sp. E54]|uniref:alpha/beta fold hydrolase n=1 Tax=Lentzea xerophila TaxID=3435883 RepID=UPI003DA4EFD5
MVPLLRRPSTSEGAARVLLLHGLGCKTTVWDSLVDRMPPTAELWEVELPWHGIDSGDWSHIGDQIEPVVCAVEAQPGFDAVVAHSFSAALLLEAYCTGKLAPRPSVLVSAFYRPRPRDFTWHTISHYLNDFHRIFAEALRVGEASRYAERQRMALAVSIRDQVGPYGWMRFFESYLRTPFLDLSGVTAPQLVLTGDSDIAADPSDGRALADGLPDGRFELIEQCGHFPMLEQPEFFARAVSDFFDAAMLPTTRARS